MYRKYKLPFFRKTNGSARPSASAVVNCHSNKLLCVKSQAYRVTWPVVDSSAREWEV